MEGASGAAVSAGGGGTSAEVTAGLQAQVDKLNELMRICKEDAEQARKEANESQAGVDGAYAEGREAREKLEVLTKQRENERAIVKKAMSELKKLQGVSGEKDAMIQKAVQRMKDLQLLAVSAKKAQSVAEQEKEKLKDIAGQLMSKVKSLNAKVKLMETVRAVAAANSPAKSPGPPAGGGGGVVTNAGSEKVIGALETQIKDLKQELANAAAAGEQASGEDSHREEEATAALQVQIEDLNSQLKTAQEVAEASTEVEGEGGGADASFSGETSFSGDGGAASEMLSQLDEQQKELEATQQQLIDVKQMERKVEAELEAAAAELGQVKSELTDVRMELEVARQGKLESEEALVEAEGRVTTALEEKALSEEASQEAIDQANALTDQKQSLLADLQESMARKADKDNRGGGVVKKVEKQNEKVRNPTLLPPPARSHVLAASCLPIP